MKITNVTVFIKTYVANTELITFMEEYPRVRILLHVYFLLYLFKSDAQISLTTSLTYSFAALILFMSSIPLEKLVTDFYYFIG